MTVTYLVQADDDATSDSLTEWAFAMAASANAASSRLKLELDSIGESYVKKPHATRRGNGK
jgi:hypothetical protein